MQLALGGLTLHLDALVCWVFRWLVSRFDGDRNGGTSERREEQEINDMLFDMKSKLYVPKHYRKELQKKDLLLVGDGDNMLKLSSKANFTSSSHRHHSLSSIPDVFRKPSSKH